MGLFKQYWMDQQESAYDEAKLEWIREQLGDDEADENTNGWDDLSEEYDDLHEADENDYDDWSVAGKSRIEIFDTNIEAAREILTVKLSESSSKNLLVMLHGHLVAAVEAYLSSTFIEMALSKDLYMRRLVENDPEFARRKFTIKEIFIKRDELKNDLTQYLKQLIFHDIAKVKPMYHSVLEIDFGEIKWMFEAVELRHHCVHRAGYDKNGDEVHLSFEDIEVLAEKAETLVHRVETELENIPDEENVFWSNIRTIKDFE